MVRLSDDQLGELKDRYEPIKPETTLEAAIRLAREGWYVFPIKPGSKWPLFPKAHKDAIEQKSCRASCGGVGHGVWDATQDEDLIREWWTANPNAGIAGSARGLAIFDLDINHGADDKGPFPKTRVHWSGRRNGNRHLIYRATHPAAKALGQKNSIFPGIDLKAEAGAYVILPPSLHEETRHPYTVGPENNGVVHEITDSELEAIFEYYTGGAQPKKRPGNAVQTVSRAVKTTTRSSSPEINENRLSWLLENPPSEGGRNNWLTKVAGHYAKMHRRMEDLYQVEVRRANELLTPALDETELEKTMDSIWSTEVVMHPEREMSESSGWLVGTGKTLECRIGITQDGHTEYATGSYGDFDMEVMGIARAEDNARTYWLQLNTRDQVTPLIVRADLFGDDRTIRKFLSNYGATVDQPENAKPKTPLGTRLQRYIESQNPRTVRMVKQLGYHENEEGFVTPDGLITAEGYQHMSEVGVVADPSLATRDISPFHYGFRSDWATAQKVLQQVNTFHDPKVTALTGAWWATTLLKPLIQKVTSMFPVFGVESPSESGKTNGYFSQMVQLGGNYRGHTTPTKPVLRDMLSANRNGVVWVDDMDDISPFGELLRSTTSNGTASKMGQDNTGVKNVEIVAPLFITGEQLNLTSQKALADRSIIIDAPSPVQRESLINPGTPQWNDIKDLMAQHPEPYGLSVYAGHFILQSLKAAEEVLDILRKYKKEHAGRNGDKIAVMLAGAHLFDHLLGEPDALTTGGETVRRVRQWANDNQNQLSHDNTLTTTIIPWALNMYAYPKDPTNHDMGRLSGIDTPVFARKLGEPTLDSPGGWEVWISSSTLAEAWSRDHFHRIENRTESASALAGQANLVTVPGTSQVFAIQGDPNGRKRRYRQLKPEYAHAVMERAQAD